MRNLMVGVECPNCRKKVEVQVRKTFINTAKSCPHCSTTFEVVGNGTRIIKNPAAGNAQ